VILLVAFLAIVLTVPLVGGRLRNLAGLDLRQTGLLLAATVLQAVITQLHLERGAGVAAVHIASYLLVGAFVWANRAVPWLWLAGVGGALNFIAIAANGGTMPASAAALRSAGMSTDGATFTNSGLVEGARLWFLGDVFAIPASMPLANVFSIGDVVLLVGGGLVVHRVAGSRMPRPSEGSGRASGVGVLPSAIASRVPVLRDNRDFRRLWLAGATSDIGDWTHSLAVIAILADRGASTGVFAALLVVQMVASSAVGVFGTPVVDRVDRMRLLAVTNVAQAVAVGSLIVPAQPAIAHFLVVAALLGGLGALVRPATMASIPNLVRPEQLVAANSFVAATFNIAVSLGPIIGAGLVTRWGARPAFTVNVLSFLLSAAFVAGIRKRGVPAPGGAHAAPDRQTWVASATEGLRHIARVPSLRTLVVMLMLVVFGAAVRGPVEPSFIVDSLGGTTGAIGALAGLWGLGMVLGSTVAVAAGRRWSLERVLVGGIGILGLSILAASQSRALGPVAVLWLVAGTGNALGSVAYETLLQQRTRDDLRGRVFGVADAVLDTTYLVGALVAVVVSETLGLRAGIAVGGGTAAVAAAYGVSVLVRRRDERAAATAEPEAPDEEAGGRQPAAPAVPHLRRQDVPGTLP
jgi:MFS family permease